MTDTLTSGLRVPVAGIPPQGPTLSLLESSVAPADEPNTFTLNGEQLAGLPGDLRAEINARASAAWTRGIWYQPENSNEATTRAPNDTSTMIDVFDPENQPLVMVDPFAIVTYDTCSPFGFEAHDFKGRAERNNDLATPKAIGAEFWTGTIAQSVGAPNNYLTNISTWGAATGNITPGASAIDNGTAQSVIDGLNLLQDALRSGAGGKGMIHCIPAAVPNLLNVRRVGKYLLDIFDNIVVPDPGYPGTGPGGATPDAGMTWMYATDLVMTRVEPQVTIYPDPFSEALDWGQNGNVNTITFYSSRMAMAYFDGFRQFAVLVNLP